MDCLVSVIIPVYNVRNYVERCARALFSQTMQDGIEFIFVDDATPDDSIEIIKRVLDSFPDRKDQSMFLRHMENRGLAAARNTGLAHSHGKYIVHSDSDDWMEPSMLEKLYSTAEKYQADIVYCDFLFQYKDHVERCHCASWGDDKVNSLNNYIESPWTVIWNIMAKRDLYYKHGLQSHEGISYYEDYNLATKLLLEADHVIHVPIALHNYNQLNQSSIMHNFGPKHMEDEIVACMDVIDYYRRRGVLKQYDKQLSYRLLKAKKELLMHEDRLYDFLNLYPNGNKYIWSCVHLNKKSKIMAWFLCHHLGFITVALIRLRNRINCNRQLE